MSTWSSILDANHCASQLELVLRFSLWAQTKRAVPDPEAIAARFAVSRATAYRWRNAWCDANGLPIPETREPMKDRFSRSNQPNRRQPVRQHHNAL